MRAPKRRRPLERAVSPVPDVDWRQLAARVRYVGSPEHKDTPSFAGHPAPRGDASICDPHFAGQRERITGWLQHAIGARVVGAFMEGDFPRYAWYWHDGTMYEARLTNRGLGEYKGYPLDREEWADGVLEAYGIVVSRGESPR